MRSRLALLAIGVALLGGLLLVVSWTASRLAADRSDGSGEQKAHGSSHDGPTGVPLATAGSGPARRALSSLDPAERPIAAGAAAQPAQLLAASPPQQPLAATVTPSTKTWTLRELNAQVLSENDTVRRRRLAQGRLLLLEYEARPLRWHIDRAEREGSWTADKLVRQRQRLQEVEEASAEMRAELKRLKQDQ